MIGSPVILASDTIDELLGLTPAEWPLPKQNLSPSQIKTYAKCPEQFRRIYVLGERRPPGAAAIIGTATHKTDEFNFRQKIDTHDDLPVSDMEFFYAEAFETTVDDAGGKSEILWYDEQPTDVFNTGLELVRAYRAAVAPRVQPLGVEERFEMPVPKIPVPVIGYTDVRTEKRLIDGKTSGKKVSKPKPDWRPQAALYQLATGLPVEFHVKAKTKTPGIYTAEDTPGLFLPFNDVALQAQTRLVQVLVAEMIHNYMTYGPNEGWPTQAPFASDWACDAKWCGFRPSCPWWRE